MLGEEDDEDDWENRLNLDELSEELVVADGVALELTLAETEDIAGADELSVAE